MPVYLEGLAIGFYRGIGVETQYIAPFSGMNLFVGANNAGKSVVLKAISERLPFSDGANTSGIEPGSVEAYRGGDEGQFFVAAGVTIESAVQQLDSRLKLRDITAEKQTAKFVSDAVVKLHEHIGSIWLKSSGPSKGAHLVNKADFTDIALLATDRFWFTTWSTLTGKVGGGLTSHWVPQTVEKMERKLEQVYPAPLIIPAKRELGPKGGTFDGQSGKGLIDHLAQLQNPGLNEQELKAQFEAINAFLQTVTGKLDARLEVPSHRDYLLVHMDGKVLPLESLGTGIHEVVLIAAYCTIHQQRIMCIEEPEIHLHPVLQRKLIRYLQEKTENQYFIATHSSAFIDTPGASVFRVWNDGVQTRVRPAITKGEKRSICDDLGVRASDILQANSVVWVEGPSDRTYIRAWLKTVDPDLREGIEYSIMFYGGGLLSHLSADDEAVGDFIALRHLNRNFAVVMDSDRDKARAGLKPAVKRIKDELVGDQNVVWITKGREIENYVNPDLLHGALKVVHSKLYKARDKAGPYDHAFYFRRGSKGGDEIFTGADKGRVAAEVVRASVDLSVLDLKERVTALAAMIRRANQAEVGSGEPVD